MGHSPWGREESDTTERLHVHFHFSYSLTVGFPGSSAVKNTLATAGDAGSIPGLERSLREGNGYPLQCSCLENSTDRGAWQATVHRITKESDMT